MAYNCNQSVINVNKTNNFNKWYKIMNLFYLKICYLKVLYIKYIHFFLKYNNYLGDPRRIKVCNLNIGFNYDFS